MVMALLVVGIWVDFAKPLEVVQQGSDQTVAMYYRLGYNEKKVLIVVFAGDLHPSHWPCTYSSALFAFARTHSKPSIQWQ
jgi:hypothetical protein